MIKHPAQIGSYQGSGLLKCDYTPCSARKEFYCYGYFRSDGSTHIDNIFWDLLENNPTFIGPLQLMKWRDKPFIKVEIPVSFPIGTFSSSDSEVGFETVITKEQFDCYWAKSELPISYDQEIILC